MLRMVIFTVTSSKPAKRTGDPRYFHFVEKMKIKMTYVLIIKIQMNDKKNIILVYSDRFIFHCDFLLYLHLLCPESNNALVEHLLNVEWWTK